MESSVAVKAGGAAILLDVKQDPAGYVNAIKKLYERQYGVIIPPVAVELSGHKARRVLGLYKSGQRCIIINEKGLGDCTFSSVLRHEFAHHVQYTTVLTEGESTLPYPGTSHGQVFDVQLARIRELAINAGMLQPLTEVDTVLSNSVERIKSLRGIAGATIIQLGEQLAKSRDRCRELGESFEVFLSECVAFSRGTAYDYIRAYEKRMPATLTFNSTRFLMRIKDDAVRERAMADAVDGVPLVTLRLRYAKPRVAGGYVSRLEALKAERKRLLVRIEEISNEIDHLNQDNERVAALTQS